MFDYHVHGKRIVSIFSTKTDEIVIEVFARPNIGLTIDRCEILSKNFVELLNYLDHNGKHKMPND